MLAGIGMGQVLDHHLHFNGVALLQLTFQSHQDVATACHQHAVEATFGQCVGKGRTDAMGGTGNHCPRAISMLEGTIRN
ncbi:hypothetical protein D3C81_1941400 [compost metagenome]